MASAKSHRTFSYVPVVSGFWRHDSTRTSNNVSDTPIEPACITSKMSDNSRIWLSVDLLLLRNYNFSPKHLNFKYFPLKKLPGANVRDDNIILTFIRTDKKWSQKLSMWLPWVCVPDEHVRQMFAAGFIGDSRDVDSGTYVSAPIPFVPTKDSLSTGVISIKDVPCFCGILFNR